MYLCNMMKKESGDDWGNFLLHHLSSREKLDSCNLFLRPLFLVLCLQDCSVHTDSTKVCQVMFSSLAFVTDCATTRISM